MIFLLSKSFFFLAVGLRGITDVVSGTLLASYPAVVQFLIELKRINGVFSMLKFRLTPPASLQCIFLNLP